MLQKPEGKQHGKKDTLLRIRQGKYPGDGSIAANLHLITGRYIYFAMLFMQQ